MENINVQPIGEEPPEPSSEEELLEKTTEPYEEDTSLNLPREKRRVYSDKSDRSIFELQRGEQRGDLKLDPEFQRNYVWDDKKASLLIESVLLEIPIPVIYLAEEADGKFTIIDGQQRLRSFFRFFENDFKLRGLKVLSDQNGKIFKTLDDKSKKKIENATIRTIEIRNETPPEVKFEIFERLNVGAVKLNEQELRNCIYRGKYNNLIRKLSEKHLSEKTGEEEGSSLFRVCIGQSLIISSLELLSVALSQEDLFKLALNLQDPWYIKSIEFSNEEKRLDLHIDFTPGSRFECTVCKTPNNVIHDTKDRVWRHLDFFQFKTYIHARVPRTKCQKCGSIRLIDVPWARRSAGFTLLMDSLILLFAQNMPVNAVAEIIDEHDTRIWRVLSHYIPESRSKEDHSQVKIVGVDETSCAKFHKYVSLFVDLDDNKVLYVCEGKDASVISSFKEDLEDHNGASENIEMFCSDMSPAFISGITEQFPGSSLTFDKFHVMKMVNDAVDQVRREEQHHNAILKNTRYVWLKNPNNLSLAEKEKLGSLKNMNLMTSKAYNFKLSLKDFWTYNDTLLAEDFLKKWYYWASHSQIGPIIDVAKTIKSHSTGIINYAETKISNGVLEGINSMVQSAKSSARGFRTTKNLILIIYLRLGKLQFNLPT